MFSGVYPNWKTLATPRLTGPPSFAGHESNVSGCILRSSKSDPPGYVKLILGLEFRPRRDGRQVMAQVLHFHSIYLTVLPPRLLFHLTTNATYAVTFRIPGWYPAHVTQPRMVSSRQRSNRLRRASLSVSRPNQLVR